MGKWTKKSEGSNGYFGLFLILERMVRIMKKKLLAIAMATTMMFSLAGCGGSSSTKSGSSDSSDSGDSIKIGVLLSTTGDFSISETPIHLSQNV